MCGGAKLPPMNGRPAWAAPLAPPRCDHGQNPQTCLTCYHARGREPKREQPRQVLGAPGVVINSPEVQAAIDASRGVQRTYAAPPPNKGPQEFNPPPRQPKPVQQAQAGIVSSTNPVAEPWRSDQ